jgi:hypothetical protein
MPNRRDLPLTIGSVKEPLAARRERWSVGIVSGEKGGPTVLGRFDYDRIMQ